MNWARRVPRRLSIGAEHQLLTGYIPGTVQDTIWRLSGIPALCEAISSRISSGEGAEFEERIVRAARNIANGIEASRQVMSKRMNGESVTPSHPPTSAASLTPLPRETSISSMPNSAS